MKALPKILAVFGTVLLSCNLIDAPIPLGEKRSSSGSGSGSGLHHGSGQEEAEESLKADTTFIVSAVVFPDSYDWQRDSAFGAVNCSLRVYRNESIAMELAAGPAAQVGVSPDKHHFIGTSLFTEYADSRGTVIKKDGELLCRWSEPEKLHGLVYRDGELYSLGISLSGGGLVYRRNGEVELRVGDAVLMGGFGHNTYGPEGALYEDDGHICFACRKMEKNLNKVSFIMDGTFLEQKSVPAKVLDAKIWHGQSVLMYSRAGNTMLNIGGHNGNAGKVRSWTNAGVMMLDDSPCIIGTCLDERGKNLDAVCAGDRLLTFPANTAYIYYDGENAAGVQQPPSDYPGSYFFHRNCARLLDGRLLAVYTPRNGEEPFLKYGQKLIKYKLHGYLSGVAVEIPD